MNKLLFLLIGLLCFMGCQAIPIESIGFCYSDDGRQYCGDIGIAKKKTSDEKSVVLEEKTEGEKPKILYTFDEDEIKVFASKLGEMNADEDVDMNASSIEPPDYMKPGLTDFRRCKLYLEKLKE